MRLLLLGGVVAAGVGAALAAESAEAPLTFDQVTIDTRVAADGSAVQTQHAEIRATNDAAAMNASRINIAFNAESQTVTVIEAFTRKPDGTKIPVDPSTIYEQPASDNPQVQIISGRRMKILLFPQFAGGDTAVYTVKTEMRPVFPGQFIETEVFPRTVAYKNVKETITAPKSLPLYVEGHDVSWTKRDAGGDVIYSMNYSEPVPGAAPVVAVSPLDSNPRFLVSTIRDYASLGNDYAALTAPKIAVTPKVRALADQITQGDADRLSQARKLYEWVLRNIRYVAVELGSGSFVPHEVDTIVSNGYGDCKDHDVLYQALLKSKGIGSQSVLINSGLAYTLTDVPTFAQLNHVITWLPEFNLYADSSAIVAPFGVLPITEYGKPIVHATVSASSRGSMPLLSAGVAETVTTATTRLSQDGVLSGTTSTTAKGPPAIVLRLMGLGIQALGPAAASQQIAAMGYKGASGTFSQASPRDLTPSYTIDVHFSWPDWSEEVAGASGFHIPSGIRLLGISGDGIMGPLYPGELKDSEPTACFSGHAAETLSMELPPGMRLYEIPEDTDIRTPNLTFAAHWSMANNVVTVHRDFTSTIDSALCTGEVRKQTAAALQKIAHSYDRTILLEKY